MFQFFNVKKLINLTIAFIFNLQFLADFGIISEINDLNMVIFYLVLNLISDKESEPRIIKKPYISYRPEMLMYNFLI